MYSGSLHPSMAFSTLDLNVTSASISFVISSSLSSTSLFQYLMSFSRWSAVTVFGQYMATSSFKNVQHSYKGTQTNKEYIMCIYKFPWLTEFLMVNLKCRM